MSDFFSNNVKLLILLVSLPSHVLSNFILNQTGGSFPNSVYLQTTFSYNFVEPTVSLSYYGHLLLSENAIQWAIGIQQIMDSMRI